METAYSHTRTRLILNETELLQKLPFLRKKQRVRGAKAAGLRYEKKVHAHFSEKFGPAYLVGPWFGYYEDSSDFEKFCQPDALLFDFRAGTITIIEIKLKHTVDAYVQLKNKYEPRVKELFPSHLWTTKCCEVVRWYDPHTYFPEDAKLTSSVENLSSGVFGVHIFSTRRRA